MKNAHKSHKRKTKLTMRAVLQTLQMNNEIPTIEAKTSKHYTEILAWYASKYPDAYSAMLRSKTWHTDDHAAMGRPCLF